MNLKFQQITKLREKKFSWSEIAAFYQIGERTTYRWNKLKEPIIWPKQKVGCKTKNQW